MVKSEQERRSGEGVKAPWGSRVPLRHILTAVLVMAAMTLTFVKMDLAGQPGTAAAIEATSFTPAPDLAQFGLPNDATGAVARSEDPKAVLVHSARLASVPKAVTPKPASAPSKRPKPAPTVVATVSAVTTGYGCGPALTYLAAHSAPGFVYECPGYALGHQAMTCINVAGVCANTKLIAIDIPCPAAYMNEASNSWVLEGLRSAPIDPYGYCH